MTRRLSRDGARDRGAVAVEFALLLPLLLLLIFGIIDFGRALNAQITLTQAAREGARLASFGDTNSSVQTRAAYAATGLSPVTVTVTDQSGFEVACPTGSAGTDNAVVTVSYKFSFITPVGAVMEMIGGSGLASPITLSARGVMPCEN